MTKRVIIGLVERVPDWPSKPQINPHTEGNHLNLDLCSRATQRCLSELVPSLQTVLRESAINTLGFGSKFEARQTGLRLSERTGGGIRVV